MTARPTARPTRSRSAPSIPRRWPMRVPINRRLSAPRSSLDGSGSTDADVDALTYPWALTSRPAGSTAVLSDPFAVSPSFSIDRAGNYVVQLIVNDGTTDSAPDAVTVSTTNSRPVANAGPDQSVLLGATVTLDGSGSSDVDLDTLSYRWAITPGPPAAAPSCRIRSRHNRRSSPTRRHVRRAIDRQRWRGRQRSRYGDVRFGSRSRTWWADGAG